jgi:hypothetical protein
MEIEYKIRKIAYLCNLCSISFIVSSPQANLQDATLHEAIEGRLIEMFVI